MPHMQGKLYILISLQYPQPPVPNRQNTVPHQNTPPDQALLPSHVHRKNGKNTDTVPHAYRQITIPCSPCPPCNAQPTAKKTSGHQLQTGDSERITSLMQQERGQTKIQPDG